MKGFCDVKVGDIIICYDIYSGDYIETYFEVESVEYDDEYSTETNPKGMVCYGKDLDAWDEEDECYINDDYISVVTEENFIGFKN